MIHAVGTITDAVYSFLEPAIIALADQGVHQTVIHLDRAPCLGRLQSVRGMIDLRPVSVCMLEVQHVKGFYRALSAEVGASPVSAMHLHGVLPLIAGARVVRDFGLACTVYFSPHGSKSLDTLSMAGVPLFRLLKSWAGTAPWRPIATVEADVVRLLAVAGDAAELVESTVDPVFFSVQRVTPVRPLILGGSPQADRSCAFQFAQLAVLLSGADSGMRFGWVGRLDDEARARLEAADVAYLGESTPAERAFLLQTAALYIAFPGARGFPVRLAEAMAAACACIAWNTPFHRGLVEVGATGLICASPAEMMSAVAVLLQSATVRKEFGAAARQSAAARFGRHSFAALWQQLSA